MKRSMCGLVLIAAAAVLWACNGDPTESLRAGEQILATPASVFLDQNESEFVTVELVDGQGNAIESDFTAQNIGSGITVEEDTTFVQLTNGSRITTRERFSVVGLTPASTSFELVSGGNSITIPVRVLPISFGGTFSNAAPAMNEAVTITAPAGTKFTPEANVIFGADTGVVLSRAADSTSITFVPVPGSAAVRNVARVSGVLSEFAPTASLTIPTVDSLTVPAATALAGTDDPGTAPAVPVPAPGGITVLFDAPDFAATIDHFYRLDIAEAGDYTLTVDWNIGNDIDAPICVSDPTCANEDFLDPTVSGNHPESGTFTLPVGTHTILVEDFGAIQHLFGLPPGTPAIGARVKILIER